MIRNTAATTNINIKHPFTTKFAQQIANYLAIASQPLSFCQALGAAGLRRQSDSF
jgi:hypothetical protein